ncbi:ArnT family glycosyltransferase [Rhodococcus sp. NPDC127528]|uniref:ArnT family glycosyltransferase n=1 Tax=unclassified Rhodococcus (in: high G+C Gram-positive bacteria) TaxID=192944 RepID=UPI00363F190C
MTQTRTELTDPTTVPRAQPSGPTAAPGTRLPATRWERIGLAVLLAGTAVAYLWNITVNGMGNQFYAAAAQAGSRSWKALLFGSLDSANFITVDKPPVSQWVMGLSGQIFGFGSASMLIPQALMAVASVALLYGAVGRISGRGAGLLAGAALALTPVAALMFRFNNPDAVMVLLMTAGAYATVRSLERASARWIALAGAALGFAFLAKMLEGLMVMPALVIAFAVAAPTPVRARLVRLLGALAAFLLSSGWFVLLTLVWPASSRPYLAGSTDDNFMNLVLGYNGFARVLGRNHPGGAGGPGPGQGAAMPPNGQAAHAAAAGSAAHGGGFGGFGGQSQGLGRLFTGEFGFEIGWLVPAALLAMVLVVVSRWRAPRTDLVRAGAIVFGGWLVVDGLVLSYMSGTIHPYYCLSLAPAVAGMFALGVHEMWTRRTTWFGRSGLAGIVLAAGAWSFWILGRNADWMPALRWVVLAVSVVSAATVLTPRAGRDGRLGTVAVAVGIVAALFGSGAYTIATLGQPHAGGGPTVGPAAAHRSGGPGGMFGASEPNPQLDSMLATTDTTWSAAVDRSSTAAGLELSSDTAVMAIGGFTGSDPTPTLAEFVDYVRNGQVTYYLVQNRTEDGGRGAGGQSQSGRGGAPGGRESAHKDIADWVTAHFTPTTVGSTTVYDLSGYQG